MLAELRAKSGPTSGWLCAQNICPMVVGHTIVYFDPGHIAIDYANELSAVFRDAFRTAIARRGAKR